MVTKRKIILRTLSTVLILNYEGLFLPENRRLKSRFGVNFVSFVNGCFSARNIGGIDAENY